MAMRSRVLRSSGATRVELRSPSPVLEPLSELILSVQCPGSPAVQRSFLVMLDPPVLADDRVLARGVVNLVENALQAMATEGGTLRVAVGPANGGHEVTIAIEDTGPGLDPDARARLFEPYFSTKSSGTGLGLAIVQRAVEGHGGRIEVESEPGSGASFRIHLPAA